MASVKQKFPQSKVDVGPASLSLFHFGQEVIDTLKCRGQIRLSETYATALSSFRRFLNGEDLALDKLDADIITAYEIALRRACLVSNTTSFYMRNLRAIYNRAVECGLIPQKSPFRHVYTGVNKTQKRAVPLEVIRQLKEMNLSNSPSCHQARDLFLFSFYTRGMAFVDMAYLKKCDLKNGFLTYIRRKTGQRIVVKWEKCMQQIVDKYSDANSAYLLPIIRPSDKTEELKRKRYIYMAHNVNRGLKKIGKEIGLPLPLTIYVARHAWASIARSKNVPLAVISEALGHDSEMTTRIYLASLDNMAIDEANSLILALI